VTARFGREGASIGPEDDLLKQGILDSLAIMQVVDHIEQDHGVALEGDEITVDNFQNLAAMAGLIERKRSGSTPS
jgi:acyl carrier protein